MNCWRKVVNAKASLIPGEFLIANQEGVRLDKGDKKSQYVNGELTLTSHRLIWSNPSVLGNTDLDLSLGFIALVEEDEGGLMSSEKIILHLVDPSERGQTCVRLAFKLGGRRSFTQKLFEALKQKRWEVKVIRPQAKGPRVMRSGIGGIQKQLEKKRKQTDSEISQAFQDIDKLMEMAKPMVDLAKSISTKIRDKQGVNEDETVQFKSYLMSLGIADPVTRDTHGSGQTYFKKLASEVFQILDKPLQDNGGMITLTDAFCRVNRARGMELLSPEDLLNACKTFDSGHLPIRLHTFDKTGVTVLQLTSAQVESEQVLSKTHETVLNFSKEGVTAEEFARGSGVAIVIAKERLLAAENVGKICRDDTVQGLRFFPNLLLTKA